FPWASGQGAAAAGLREKNGETVAHPGRHFAAKGCRGWECPGLSIAIGTAGCGPRPGGSGHFLDSTCAPPPGVGSERKREDLCRSSAVGRATAPWAAGCRDGVRARVEAAWGQQPRSRGPTGLAGEHPLAAQAGAWSVGLV